MVLQDGLEIAVISPTVMLLQLKLIFADHNLTDLLPTMSTITWLLTSSLV